MIVRELIAVLGIELDDRDVKKVDSAVSQFEGRVQKVGQFVGGSIFLAGFARAAAAVVGLASDAEETMNVIGESFGANAADVEAWSTRVAKEVGRSEFMMREMAGTLGALLTPTMEGNTEASAEMATTLAKLAVDLGSFFNTSEDVALEKLRAGLVGSTEPLLAFGVNLQVASLEQFALTQGITKSVKAMTNSEKTALRYRLILRDTAQAQGDAARTADGFANASRAASDGIKDLATRIGTTLLPIATRFATWTRDAARNLVEVIQKTNILQAALIVLAAALGVAAVMMLAPFLPFLITAAKVILVIGAITLAVDELLTFFTGGQTVIGEFIDMLFGIGAAQQFVDDLNAGWETMFGWWEKLLGLGDKLGGVLFDLFGDKKPDLSAPAATTGGVRRAVGAGVNAGFVTSRKGSTGRDLRLRRARELGQKKRLSKREKLELSRITDQGGVFRRESSSETRIREFDEGFNEFRDTKSRRRQEDAAASRRALAENKREFEIRRQEFRNRGRSAREYERRFGPRAQARKSAQGRQREFNQGFQTARAPATGLVDVESSIITIEAPVTIAEASNPEAVRRAVQQGISDAVADAGASTARGVR